MKDQKGLTLAIIFASLAVSGSLVFFGMQFASSQNSFEGDDLEAAIASGIDDYVDSQVKNAPDAPSPAQEIVIEGDMADDDAFLGDESAPVTLVEFSDFQCPFCRSFYGGAYQEIKEKYVDTGKVKFVYRDYPLSFHQDALPAAMATECARDQKGDESFFAMHDKIFDGQSGGGTVAIPRDSLDQYAKDLELDFNEYTTCMDEEKFKSEINADMLAGQKAGITGTPGFIVDGQKISGAQPFSVFEEVIENALNKYLT